MQRKLRTKTINTELQKVKNEKHLRKKAPNQRDKAKGHKGQEGWRKRKTRLKPEKGKEENKKDKKIK